MPSTFVHSTLRGTELHEDKRVKQPVRAASTVNVSLTSPGATLDGVTLSGSDRILLKNQTTTSQNGIYVWTSATATLTRSLDATAASDFVYGFLVYVREGTTNGNTLWNYSQSAAVTLETTAITFTTAGAGAGSVTSVALTAPSDLLVSGSPVTGSGTLALARSNQAANKFMAGPASGAAATPAYRSIVPGDVPSMVASGASHAAGLAPDPGVTAGTTRVLREDGTWAYVFQQSGTAPALVSNGVITTAGITESRVAPTGAVTGAILQSGTYGGQPVWVVNEAAFSITFAAAGTSHVADGVSAVIPALVAMQFVWDAGTSLWYHGAAGSTSTGTVTSVALTVPAEFSVSGSPVTTSGTLAIAKANQSANQVYAGPASGAAAAPAFRAIVPADVPAMVASGGSHAAGLVPDPGATAGVTRFLREDATFAVPAGGSGSSGSGGTGGSIVPIQTQTLSAVSPSITFSVPTGFKNLRLTGQGQSNAAVTDTLIQVQFNGDTGANYDMALVANTVATESHAQTSWNNLYFDGASAPSNQATAIVIEIPNHSNTTFRKNGFGRVTLDRTDTSGTFVMTAQFRWRNTAAITLITLSLASGSFVVGTSFTLWGEADTAPVLLTSNSNLIQETVLSAAQATISIPNIPQGYRDLRLHFTTRTTSAAAAGEEWTLNVNGDTGANYDSLSPSTTNGTTAHLGTAAQGGTAANRFDSAELVLYDYTNTTSHKIIASQEQRFDSAISQAAKLAIWHPTTPVAITSITLQLLSGGNLAAGTTVRLYGEPASAAGPSVGTGTRLRNSAVQSATSGAALVLGWDTEDQDADNQHYTSVAALTGTLAKTAGSNAIVGTSTLFTTELTVGQVISVPGTAAEVAVVIAIADATHLTVATNFANTATGQTATRVNSAVVFRQPGFFTLETTVYSGALASGNVTLQYRLNGSTMIDQKDQSAINASAGYELVTQRQFQQWDYVETLWTQNSGGAVNVQADERTHWSIGSRPTVIVAIPYINIQDQKALGTNAGSATAGSWFTRTLNTLVSDTAAIASLLNNQITLPAGTYRVNAQVPGGTVDRHVTRLYNVTDSAIVSSTSGLPMYGTAEFNPASALYAVGWSKLIGKFQLTGTKALVLQQIVQTSSANAYALGQATSLAPEVYSFIELWKEG